MAECTNDDYLTFLIAVGALYLAFHGELYSNAHKTFENFFFLDIKTLLKLLQNADAIKVEDIY